MRQAEPSNARCARSFPAARAVLSGARSALQVEGGTLLGVGSTCSAVAATTFGAAAFTQEANAYYQGVQQLGGDAVVDSQAACESLCSNSTACTMWSWCPSSVDGWAG